MKFSREAPGACGPHLRTSSLDDVDIAMSECTCVCLGAFTGVLHLLQFCSSVAREPLLRSDWCGPSALPVPRHRIQLTSKWSRADSGHVLLSLPLLAALQTHPLQPGVSLVKFHISACP